VAWCEMCLLLLWSSLLVVDCQLCRWLHRQDAPFLPFPSLPFPSLVETLREAGGWTIILGRDGIAS